MADEQKTHIGRPTKLTDELVSKAKLYLLGEHEVVGDIVPSHAGLCCYLGVVKSTLYAMAKDDSELGRDFSNTLSAIMVKQESKLINGGLSSNYNAAITKLMMSNHGYSDKQEKEDTDSRLIEVIADLAKRLPD